MKSKKKITENPNITVADKKSGRLRRYRERLEKENREREKRLNALFRKRVNSASEKKAPETVRTKAYYRFSAEYPSRVSPDGFRENIAEKKKMTVKAKIFTAVVCILVFVFTLTALEAGLQLSKRESADTIPEPVFAEEQKINAMFIPADEFRDKTAPEITEAARSGGYDTVLVEFKSEYGYVYFYTGAFVGASADRIIPGAADKLKEIIDNDINCIAYISCFKDSVAASSLSGMEVLTSAGGLFTDSTGNMWLDPYSDAAGDYLVGIMQKAVEAGFSAVMLDNVCFPSEFYTSSPVYLSYADGDTKNGALTEFINKASAAVGSDRLIVCGDITAFTEISSLPDDKYGGTLLSTDCISFCLDLRADRQYTAQLENSEMFGYVEEMPLAFILDAGSVAAKALGEQKQAYILYAIVDGNVSGASQYADYAGIKNVITDIRYD